MPHKSDYMSKTASAMGGKQITPMEVRLVEKSLPRPHRRGYGGAGSSPVKFRKREGGLND